MEHCIISGYHYLRQTYRAVVDL